MIVRARDRSLPMLRRRSRRSLWTGSKTPGEAIDPEGYGTLPPPGDAPDAVSAPLAVPHGSRLPEPWQIWESFAGIDRTEADRRLAPHLGADGVARVRCALWGVSSLGGE